ncbi:MAG: energy transducer TonB, partial [candidate division KSB1 bacterium]|nr:energy transducer TonB [candidate division KSB1 bacterium]
MPTFWQNLSDRNKSLLLSAVIHALITVVFLTIRAGLNLPVEFAEIGFVSAAPARSSTGQTAENRRMTPVQQPPQQAVTAEPKKNQAPKNEPKPPVEMPKRAHSEEKPLLKENKPAEKPFPAAQQQPKEAAQPAEKAPSSATGEQPSENTTPSQTDNPLNGQGADNRTPYTIEGDAAQRRIIAQYIPDYPPGLQREAVVKIRFWVAPDGRITQMIPVIKGDPKLEAITMDALRRWRFSALMPHEEQKT